MRKNKRDKKNNLIFRWIRFVKRYIRFINSFMESFLLGGFIAITLVTNLAILSEVSENIYAYHFLFSIIGYWLGISLSLLITLGILFLIYIKLLKCYKMIN